PAPAPVIYTLSLHDALPISTLAEPRRALRKAERPRRQIANTSLSCESSETPTSRKSVERDVAQRARSDPNRLPGLVEIKGKVGIDRKSTRLNSSHVKISYAV